MARIQLVLHNEVARLTLQNSPGNRIDFAMRQELRDAVLQISASDAKVALVQGAGADFCHGGDVREWPGLASAELRPRLEVYAEALDLLRRLTIPTVAVVKGACRGGGFELALSCDFIVAARSAEFSFPEASLGILTLQGGAMLLAQRLGAAKALELVLLGASLPAERLLDWNVINHVTEDALVDQFAADFASRLAAVETSVCAATKTLLRIWHQRGAERAMAALYDLSMPLFDRAETQSALGQLAGEIAKSS
jgi:enoyl-CoA hydratase/carnithine racemase